MLNVLRNITGGLSGLKRAWLGQSDELAREENNLDLPHDASPIFKDELSWHKPAGAPNYAPAVWNEYRDYFNCYSYALRLSRAGWSQPGTLATGLKDNFDFTANYLQQCLQQDGLKRVREHDRNGRDHVIAAFVSPVGNFGVGDYHFYSLDADNSWSHKIGGRQIEKHDAAGRSITNVLKADRAYSVHNYSIFGGYYRLPAEGILYLPKSVIIAP